MVFSVPLCFCYRKPWQGYTEFCMLMNRPTFLFSAAALLHYKACARTRKQKFLDLALLVFGLFATVYTTSQTVSSGSQLRLSIQVKVLTMCDCGFFAAADRDAADERRVCATKVWQVPAEVVMGIKSARLSF